MPKLWEVVENAPKLHLGGQRNGLGFPGAASGKKTD